MDVRNQESDLEQLAEFVHDECQKRLKAYEAQPRDAAEHFETENEVLSGGYAYRQLYELVQNAADCVFWGHPATDSESIRPPIPILSGHRFRSIRPPL
jgi:hypothetical protein